MMHMTFYWSRQVTLLFNSWKTDSWLSYGLTLLACFIVPVFYQYLEDRRIQIVTRNRTEIEVPLLRRKVVGKLSAARVAGTVLFGLNSGIGYMLMLAVMSFNGGVFLAIVFGLTIGYLVFRSGNDDAVVDNPCACA